MGAFFVSSLSITWRKKLRSFQNCSARMRHNRIAALSHWCGQVKRWTLPHENFLKSFARPNTDFVDVRSAINSVELLLFSKKNTTLYLRQNMHNPFTRSSAGYIRHLKNFVVFFSSRNVMELNHNLFRAKLKAICRKLAKSPLEKPSFSR